MSVNGEERGARTRGGVARKRNGTRRAPHGLRRVVDIRMNGYRSAAPRDAQTAARVPARARFAASYHMRHPSACRTRTNRFLLLLPRRHS
ncbi:hypothetical protein [Burkholderia multivorans]|uniref:Uncharacterized protein n=1 Tax=Burkholderia multivorans (strain ATCC 17616 / 249) TaxID=395019 RepID=A0A0H3KXK2_BURM1|nr:hypothetical protein [Burkholderia multivorans]BAG47132.1 unique hypothetical protein [Burkholderia multivorans ATCC 17616]